MGQPQGQQRAHLTVHGRVQGVMYRASARAAAKELGLTGWVRNLPDGTVEAVAEGQRRDLDKLVLWCRQGPNQARVTRVDVEFVPATGEFADFAVRA
ncbi:MAG: acylphosphatase [Anaerolineae bacterium]